MISKNIIKELLKNRGWSQNKLASAAGFKSQSNITGILNRASSMRVDVLVQMVEAMGYEVIIRDRTGDRKEWTVTDGKEDSSAPPG